MLFTSSSDYKQDIECSSLCTKPAKDLDGLVSQYNTVLTDLMDKYHEYAHAKQKTMILRPNTDWHTDEIDLAIAARRKAEEGWRSSKLTVHHQIQRDAPFTKRDFYNRKVSDAGSDRRLCSLSNHDKQKPYLPTNINKDEIADKFAEFFTDNVGKIRSDVDKKTPSIRNKDFHTAIKLKENTLNQFQPG